MGKQCVVVVEGVCQVTPLGLFVFGGDTQQACWQAGKRVYVPE